MVAKVNEKILTAHVQIGVAKKPCGHFGCVVILTSEKNEVLHEAPSPHCYETEQQALDSGIEFSQTIPDILRATGLVVEKIKRPKPDLSVLH